MTMKNIECRNIGEKVVILHCLKELSFNEARDFEEGLLMVMKSFPNVILDMSSLGYIDSSIVGVIRKMSRRPEANIYVVTPSNSIAGMIIKVINLSKIVETYETMKDVLNKLGVGDEIDTNCGEWDGENFRVRNKKD